MSDLLTRLRRRLDRTLGGTIVHDVDRVGPDSVGYRVVDEALVIEDVQNRRVRNLVSETPFPAGENTAF